MVAMATRKTPRSQPGTRDLTDRAKIEQLARDMVISAINVTAVVPRGQEMRQFVREARRFYSELAAPTIAPETLEKKKAAKESSASATTKVAADDGDGDGDDDLDHDMEDNFEDDL